jgi:hypothetical protein
MRADLEPGPVRDHAFPHRVSVAAAASAKGSPMGPAALMMLHLCSRGFQGRSRPAIGRDMRGLCSLFCKVSELGHQGIGALLELLMRQARLAFAA